MYSLNYSDLNASWTTHRSQQFSKQFCNNKNTINVLSKYNIIVGSKNGLLTNATKPDVSDVASQERFYAAASISHFF